LNEQQDSLSAAHFIVERVFKNGKQLCGSHLGQKPEVTEIHSNEERGFTLHKASSSNKRAISTQRHNRIRSLNYLTVRKSGSSKVQRFGSLSIDINLKVSLLTPGEKLPRKSDRLLVTSPNY
jgi:hypothetical protein